MPQVRGPSGYRSSPDQPVGLSGFSLASRVEKQPVQRDSATPRGVVPASSPFHVEQDRDRAAVVVAGDDVHSTVVIHVGENHVSRPLAAYRDLLGPLPEYAGAVAEQQEEIGGRRA